jgi:hypothetical protein
MRHAAVLAGLVVVSCAPARKPSVGDPSPALHAALADTARLSRVYFAGEVAKPVAPRAGNEPPRTMGLPDGEVHARVVVGADGRPDVAMVELLPGSAPGLAERFIRVLGAWRFYAAELSDGSKVRQLVVVRLSKRGNGNFIDITPAPR